MSTRFVGFFVFLKTPTVGFEPTTFGLEVQRASPLRHTGLCLRRKILNHIYPKKKCAKYPLRSCRKSIGIENIDRTNSRSPTSIAMSSMDTLVHFTPDSMVRITSTTTWYWRQEHRFLHLIPSQVGTISFLIGSKKPRKKYTKKVHSYAYNPFWDVSAYIGSYTSMKKWQNRVLPWRNWLARSTVNRKVGGSSPPGSGVLRKELQTPNRHMRCLGNVHDRPHISGHFDGNFGIGFSGNIVRSRVGLNHQPFD